MAATSRIAAFFCAPLREPAGDCQAARRWGKFARLFQIEPRRKNRMNFASDNGAGAAPEILEVRLPEQLDGLDGLVIPGGESTTIMQLARLYGLDEAIREFGGALFGTCAGMIVLDREHLGLAEIDVERNAYGRQVRSFEADVHLEGDERPFRGVFIRAPRVRDLGTGVEVLGELDGEPVLVRDGRMLLATFH